MSMEPPNKRKTYCKRQAMGYDKEYARETTRTLMWFVIDRYEFDIDLLPSEASGRRSPPRDRLFVSQLSLFF
jgi:hypothetical protein